MTNDGEGSQLSSPLFEYFPVFFQLSGIFLYFLFSIFLYF